MKTLLRAPSMWLLMIGLALALAMWVVASVYRGQGLLAPRGVLRGEYLGVACILLGSVLMLRRSAAFDLAFRDPSQCHPARRALAHGLQCAALFGFLRAVPLLLTDLAFAVPSMYIALTLRGLLRLAQTHLPVPSIHIPDLTPQGSVDGLLPWFTLGALVGLMGNNRRRLRMAWAVLLAGCLFLGVVAFLYAYRFVGPG